MIIIIISHYSRHQPENIIIFLSAFTFGCFALIILPSHLSLSIPFLLEKKLLKNSEKPCQAQALCHKQLNTLHHHTNSPFSSSVVPLSDREIISQRKNIWQKTTHWSSQITKGIYIAVHYNSATYHHPRPANTLTRLVRNNLVNTSLIPSLSLSFNKLNRI